MSAPSAILVRAPARLHLGMFHVSGYAPRRFGGIGVALERPAVVLEAEPDDVLSVEGPDAQRAATFARRCAERLGLPGGARLRVREAIPTHAGLGSGTKLALAVAAALHALHDRPLEPPELARAVGRGGRSAVGLWTFALGGLVVEGGRREGSDAPAPVLARYAMPERWRCVVVLPAAAPGLSGAAEEAAFGGLVPQPEHVRAVAAIVLTALLPALVEEDVREFGRALTAVQRHVGDAFASAQGGRFHPEAARAVDALLDLGAAGAGQSSWGPATYGVVGSEPEAVQLAERLRRTLGPGADVQVVRFENRPARVERA